MISVTKLFIIIFALLMVYVKSELLKCSGPYDKTALAVSVTNQCCQSIKRTIGEYSGTKEIYCDVKEDIASFANCCKQQDHDLKWVDC